MNDIDSFSLSDATLSDLEAINQLMRISKGYWGYDKNFLDRFMLKLMITPEYLQKNPVKLLYVTNKLVGFYSFIFNEDGTLELDNFFLHPDFIGKGLGLFLWQSCLTTAKALGKNEFIIWSDPNAEDFYVRMGCEKIGVRQSPMLPNRFPAVFKYKID